MNVDRFDERDLVLLVGLLLLGAGCGWIFLPLGLLVPGLVLVLVALWPGPRSARPHSRTRFVRRPAGADEDRA